MVSYRAISRRDLSVVHKDFTLFVTLTVQIHQQGSSKVVKKAGWHDVDLAEIDQVITDSDLPGETVSARPLTPPLPMVMKKLSRQYFLEARRVRDSQRSRRQTLSDGS
jgi:hypothetical protein